MPDEFDNAFYEAVKKMRRQIYEDVMKQSVIARYIAEVDAQRRAEEAQNKSILEVFRMAFLDLRDDATILPVRGGNRISRREQDDMQHYEIISGDLLYEFTATLNDSIQPQLLSVLIVDMDGQEALITITKLAHHDKEEKQHPELPSPTGDPP